MLKQLEKNRSIYLKKLEWKEKQLKTKFLQDEWKYVWSRQKTEVCFDMRHDRCQSFLNSWNIQYFYAENYFAY